MKINFRQPRYVLPLIVLPFLCLFFYVYQTGFAKEEAPQQEGDPLQGQIAEVSEDVKNRALSDKLAAYREQYRRGDGYTAIGQLQEERAEQFRFDELYNEEEKRRLDSIERALKNQRPFSGNGDSENDDEDRTLQQALSSLQRRPEPIREEPEKIDPMELFRMQMAYADSMARANDPDEQAARRERERVEEAKRELENQPLLSVSKYATNQGAFNTIRAESDNTFIQAIIDENMTGYADSRLRIRLIDDLLVGPHVVKKGRHVFARISGFSGQRVLLTITSIMHGNNILPVRLEVYDNDGSPGLYVPASAFREFSRELGGNTTQGITLQQQAENNSQLVMSAIQRMFQSTTTAVSKHIRKNRAKLKYNTMVYLIDPQALRQSQQNYKQ
ncbi:conjugative transposon protein TraM [Sphingobacterium daejeonense]|uniref:conjugative transposon protein TraM n=1 Tax=Sphingobacterium daejeonense TaxID=371142 RepID=UPI0021A7C79D|nr:conjugative transposon protein TraM [Sphingobacterium daejeonense]MCT1530212.1 conjugative transposon protein TraM [Sphingobacterium daejeonense]